MNYLAQINKFRDALINSDKRAIGRRLNQGLELRNAARHKFTTKISKEDAIFALDLAKDLIALLEEKLSK